MLELVAWGTLAALFLFLKLTLSGVGPVEAPEPWRPVDMVGALLAGGAFVHFWFLAPAALNQLPLWYYRAIFGAGCVMGAGFAGLVLSLPFMSEGNEDPWETILVALFALVPVSPFLAFSLMGLAATRSSDRIAPRLP